MIRRLLPFAAVCLLITACASTQAPATVTMHDRPLATVRQLASEGDLEATHDLCYRYIYGRHAKKDYGEARLWCAMAAVAGIDSSQVLLAEMYHYGRGMPVDDKMALLWYTAAANRGHPHALLMLFYIYDEGRGVEADRAVAMSYLQRAADLGYERAVSELARQDTPG